MPTYEYECDACGHKFDELQSFSEKPLKKCPKCKKAKLRRLFGAGAAVLFKGSGFYQTDYRSSGYQAAAKADQEQAKAPSSDTAGTNGTADKPAAKGTADNAGGAKSGTEGNSSGKKAK